jgi:hypothetical protein
MKRYLNCFSLIVFILFFFSTSVFAQMTSEETEVVDTLQAHFKACRESDDYREIIRYFTPDAVNYGGGGLLNFSASIAGEKINPMLWKVGSVENNDDLVNYGKGVAKRKAVFTSTPGLEHEVVMLNVNVKGIHAIAYARHTTSWPVNEGKATMYSSHCSVWMLKKISNEWKITSWIGGISASQMTYEPGPYSQ